MPLSLIHPQKQKNQSIQTFSKSPCFDSSIPGDNFPYSSVKQLKHLRALTFFLVFFCDLSQPENIF